MKTNEDALRRSPAAGDGRRVDSPLPATRKEAPRGSASQPRPVSVAPFGRRPLRRATRYRPLTVAELQRPRKKTMPNTPAVGANELALIRKHTTPAKCTSRRSCSSSSRGLRHERRARWDTTAGDVAELLECATHSSTFEWGNRGAARSGEQDRMSRSRLGRRRCRNRLSGRRNGRRARPRRVAAASAASGAGADGRSDRPSGVLVVRQAAATLRPLARSTFRRGPISAATTQLALPCSSSR